MTDEENANRTAVALGNFDGMHVGHMAVLEAAKGFRKEGLVPVAVLFDEHSMKAITGTAPPMLMTVGERNEFIIKNGLKIETIIFNEIKNLSPEDFVEKILIKKLRAAAVCCGYNYRFGKNAAGTAQTMQEICNKLGIKCKIAGEVDVAGCAVSSTQIRDLIENGEIKEEAKEEVMRLLKSSFRPEFLNRLDEIVFYKPLQKTEIGKIVDLMLEGLKKRLEEQQIELDITSTAKDYIIDNGYDPVYGARPLKRFIQRTVETMLAKKIIGNYFAPGDTAVVDYDGSDLTVYKRK